MSEVQGMLVEDQREAEHEINAEGINRRLSSKMAEINGGFLSKMQW